MNSIQLEEARALSRGPSLQAPAIPAATTLAHVTDCLNEPGITELRRACLEQRAALLAELAAEQAEYEPHFPDSDYAPVGAEELAQIGLIATRPEELMAA